MPAIDIAALKEMVSTPMALGSLAALLAVLLIIALLRAGLARSLLPLTVLVVVSLGAMAILDRLAQGEHGAERRALAQRYAELTAQSLVPGSSLACLDGAAGDAVETACEKTIFAGPQGTAAAVAYVAARLTLLADGLAFARASDPGFAAKLSGLRRAIELDRFGVAAHVLAVRDGCTAEHCDVFALLHDANIIKSNLKAQIFDQYVSRYAADWNKAEPKTVPMAQQPPAAAPALSSLEPAPSKTPLSGKYDFPSAASIPPVSIMNAEPPLPKDAADGQIAAHAAPPTSENNTPVPQKRPQARAASPTPH